LTKRDTVLTDRDRRSRIPLLPDHVRRCRQRHAGPIIPVLEVRPSEPDVRICQRNVPIDQAGGPSAAMMGSSVPVHAGLAGPEPDRTHHEGHLGCRRSRPTAMTSRHDRDAEPRTGYASSRFSEDLRRVLETELLKGPCTSREIARLFSMHHRTLSRHLAREGVTFQQVVDEIRFAIACDLLANTELALNQISVVLQYSEPSAFTRAFRHWSGQAPSAWRASRSRNRKGPGRRAVPRPR
jgi:AraC-like DNA-binding protein